MFCPYCGRDAGDAALCPYCNEIIGNPSTVVNSFRIVDEQSNAPKAPKFNILAILGFLLSLFGLGMPALTLGVLALIFAKEKYENKGIGLAIAAIVLGIVLPPIYFVAILTVALIIAVILVVIACIILVAICLLVAILLNSGILLSLSL